MVTELTDKKRTLIFINMVVSGVASSLLTTALMAALPHITMYFGVNTAAGQWVNSGFSLVAGTMLPLTAFLVTRFPTKKLYTGGIFVFICGLLLSIIATNFFVMMLGRVLQACGNALMMSIAQVVILTIYPAEKRGTMMGTYGLATTAAPVIAPTIAGFMIDSFGWKSILYVVLCISSISLVIAVTTFDDVLKLYDKKFDMLSFVESVITFGGITLGVGNITAYGLISLQAGAPLAAGVIGAVFFVHRQLRLEKPFLDLRILRCGKYAVSVISSMLFYFTMMGASVLMPLYVQTVMGRSAVVSGLVTLPGSLATALISPLAGRLYDKMGIKHLFVAGSGLLLASNLGMFLISTETPLAVASVLNVIRNISIGALMMPLLTWGTSYVEREKVADATSLLSSLRTIAGSIGSAVFVGIMTLASAGERASNTGSALMYGTNISFLCMAVFSVVLLLTAVFTVRNEIKA